MTTNNLPQSFKLISVSGSEDDVLITTDEEDVTATASSDVDQFVTPPQIIQTNNDNQSVQQQGIAFKIPRFDKPVDSSHLKTLPEFKKRPLSDTPFVSKTNSPVLGDANDNDLSTVPLSNLNETDEDNDADIDESDKEISKLSPISSNETNNEKAVRKLLEKNINENNYHMNIINKSKINEVITPYSTANSSNRSSFTINPQSYHERQIQKPKRRPTTLDVPGLTKSRDSPDGTISQSDIGSKLVIVMVGLPARGKSYITNKLARYLNWMHHECKVFNVGNTRRKVDLMDTSNIKESGTTHNADFFAPNNVHSKQVREKWALDTLDELLEYVLKGTGSIGIFDATNSTRARRAKIVAKINEKSNNQLKILFLESICDDPVLIQQNMRLKLSGPDYRHMDKESALKDFSERLRNYEKVYETIDETEEKIIFSKHKKDVQYVKMINVGRKIISYNIQGFLASQTIYFLLNFNLSDRLIILTRHGESMDNVEGKIGGDSDLTPRGIKFSKALAKFVIDKKDEFRIKQLDDWHNKLEINYTTDDSDGDWNSQDEDDEPPERNFGVWTSMLKRSIQTARFFNNDEFFVKEMRMLNELGAGVMEGMTYKEIQEKYPDEFSARINNKLSYRYPGLGGESYLDVVNRLKPIISEIERADDHLLLITHRVVSRILLGYFLNISKEHIGELDIPLHSVYILEPKPYGVAWSLYEFDENTERFFKVDKDKYTRPLNEIKLTNEDGEKPLNKVPHRKYSVVPSLPAGKLAMEFKNNNNNTPPPLSTSNSTINPPKSTGLNLLDKMTSAINSRRYNPKGGFEMDKLKERLSEVQNSRKKLNKTDNIDTQND